ncbi:hypothetical protein MHK03_02710 [Corynebacterium simulans]|uniref:hypothetical protein n=1 Tax=Corynebacterium simulans TaxID=146827 RepID=UPI001EF24314|nr:hypothetical protein [Corynebacterium simulans]MCG7246842.1 hypothetical protein [Corynebacterium simulans]
MTQEFGNNNGFNANGNNPNANQYDPNNPFGQSGQPVQGGQPNPDLPSYGEYGEYSAQGGAGYAGAGNAPNGNQMSGQLQGPPPRLDAGDAIGQGFKGFFRNAGPWILAPLAHLVIMVLLAGVIVAIIAGLAPSTSDPSDPGNTLASIGGVFCAVFILLYSFWMTANVYRAAAKETDGQRASFGDFFKSGNTFGLMGHYIAVEIIVIVGFILLIIPGLIAGFFLYFVPFIKADNPEMSLGETFRTSFNLTKNNVGQSLLCIIVGGLLVSLLAYIPIVGLPFALGIQAFIMMIFYRHATGRPVHRWV